MRSRGGRSLSVRPLRASELEQAAVFIAQLNRERETYIGFCGTDPAEIFATLQDDFGDVPAADAFVVGERAGAWVGLLGFDADKAQCRAELWGPFVRKGEGTDVATHLWHALELPTEILEAQLYAHARHLGCRSFAAEHGFVEEVPTHILRLERGEQGQPRPPQSFTRAERAAFIALHDSLFPGTYYSGATILERLSEQRRLFTARDAAGLAGYVYAEVVPAFGEASLEFVGVAPRARGQGVGTRLVNEALDWLFSFGSVQEVTLVVSTRREAALRLYARVGFTVQHEMQSFLKTW